MIVIDTHIWIWWVTQSPRFTDSIKAIIAEHRDQLGLNVYSCWEVAKLVEKNKLQLHHPVHEWTEKALDYSKVTLMDLTVPIAIKSTQLEDFHNDPADQIIVATALIHNYPLLTVDKKIVDYEPVRTIEIM